jgi:hypothetical protein
MSCTETRRNPSLERTYKSLARKAHGIANEILDQLTDSFHQYKRGPTLRSTGPAGTRLIARESRPGPPGGAGRSAYWKRASTNGKGMLAPGVALLTYVIRHEASPPSYTLRSSVWQHRGERWQMVFHQSTRTSAEQLPT